MNRRNLIVSLVGIITVAFGALAITLATRTSPQLGLDLQGGASVVLQPVGDYDSESLDLAVERIRQRVDSLGVAEPEIIRQGDTIVVNLPGVDNQDRALRIVGRTAELRFRPVLQDFGVISTDTSTTTPSGETTAPTTATTTATTTDSSTATTEAGSATTAAASTTAASTTTLAEGALPTTPPEENTPDAIVMLLDRNGSLLQLGPSALTGEGISDAQPVFDRSQNEWSVSVDLKDAGNAAFNTLAAACYNKESTCPTGRIAIELDGEVQTAPNVLEPTFSGAVSITGGFGQSEADDLATVLRSGRLPVQLEPQAVQTVSATLGKDSLRAGIISGLVGVALVLVLMLLYYRKLALVVVAGLTISGALLWSTIAMLSRTRGLALSLAGATGIIVSIGVTVDSYVVFFERLKDDVKTGKTIKASAAKGFQSAWRTILAADIVSLIGAGALWYLSVGSVRGFAFFLGLSTLADMVVAWFFTRPAVLLLSRTSWLQGQHVLGVDRGEATLAGGVPA